jgi:hypothetical protein
MTDESSAKQSETPNLSYFVGLIFLWLIPCFVVWVSLSGTLAFPAVWVNNLLLTSALPEFVHSFTNAGPQAMLATHFGELDGNIVTAQLAGYRLGFPINTRILSYSLPFYAALHFATQTTVGTATGGNNYLKFGKGLVILYALLILGLISVNLKNLMLGLGGIFIESNSTTASVIALAYQLSTLMIPPLAPILVWAWQSKESPLLHNFLSKVDPSAPC